MSEQPSHLVEILIASLECERDAFRDLANVWRTAYFDQSVETERLRKELEQIEGRARTSKRHEQE